MNCQFLKGHDGFFYLCFPSESDAEEWMKERDMNLCLWCAGGYYNAIRIEDILCNIPKGENSEKLYS